MVIACKVLALKALSYKLNKAYSSVSHAIRPAKIVWLLPKAVRHALITTTRAKHNA
jgi:hypothetical protein